MGVYNPHSPHILGQEWVPIRDESVTFSPASNAIEIGQTFATLQAYTLQDARFYIQEMGSNIATGQVMQAAIYPKGAETQSGPIRSVVIPVTSAASTGSGVAVSGSSIVSAVQSPNDTAWLLFTADGSNVAFFFNTSAYTQLLNGKRILGVNFLYTAACASTDCSTSPLISVGVENDAGASAPYGYLSYADDVFTQEYTRQRFGEVNPHWSTSLGVTTNERQPWTNTSLQRFEASSASRLRVMLRIVSGYATGAFTVRFGYAALEVLYCEERRIATAGAGYNLQLTGTTGSQYRYGTNPMTMRDLSFAANPVLAAGIYVMTLSSPDTGDTAEFGFFTAATTGYPKLNALRELYQIPPHPLIQLNKPFPVDAHVVGLTFSEVDTHIAPQMSLHVSTGPIPEVHVYGRQAAAQVYGTVTATQELADAGVPAATPFRWSRYYARRFGNTTVPLQLFKTVGGDNNSISVAAFDALPEILDGWKQVDLYWNTPPTMGGGTNPQWKWISTGELISSRWEILGTYAPALSGIAGNLLNPIPPPHQLSIATYGQPASGAAINLGWVPGYAPPVSATTDDPTADAFLIFAQEMPTVAGLEVVVREQELTGIGQECGLDPCCIPTALSYNELTWDTPTIESFALVYDSFTRVTANGWGTANTGQAWTTNGGIAGNYATNGTMGTMTMSTKDVDRYVTLTGVVYPVTELVTTMSLAVVPTGGDIFTTQILWYVDANTHIRVDLQWATNQSMTLFATSKIGGVFVQMGSSYSLHNFIAGNQITVRTRIEGGYLKTKAWYVGEAEPEDWQIEAAIPLTQTQTAAVGVRTYAALANTNVSPVASFDNFSYGPPQMATIEIDRMDTVETDWQNIMSASFLGITGFNDYEARVGILSSYRIRLVDVYDFPGPWSSTVTQTIPAPGVDIGCDDGHLLIFTSNERQDGSVNLAYSSVWEGRVEEDFAFSEAGFVQLQAMYNRDFYTAFRPSERGGEQFQRTVLVQAAAIAPETLGDFTSLRDMAWEDVSYICVRDEDGNRWFATVLVPSGRVLRDRRLYMAPVQIIEVTATPSPVDP